MKSLLTLRNIANNYSQTNNISFSVSTLNNEFVQNFNTGICIITKKLNNIFITILNSDNKVILSKSGGNKEFKGAKKITPYRTEMLAKACVPKLLEANITKLIVKINANIKTTSIKSILKGLIHSQEISILSLENDFSYTQNSCRPKKMRRI